MKKWFNSITNSLKEDKIFKFKYSLPIFIVTIIIASMPVVYRINSIPLIRWDESLYTFCAYELAHNGEIKEQWDNYFYSGEPNYMTKPELVILSQAFWMKILGYDSKLAIRMHSVVASILTILLLLAFSIKEFKSLSLGIFSSLVLVTLKGYMFHHVARSGDMDGLLVFFSTLLVISFYYYIKHFDKRKVRNSALSVITVSLIGAYMAKMFAGMFFLPALFVYALYKRKLIPILQLRSTYVASIVYIGSIIAYYAIMEWLSPGHVHHVIVHDVARLYSSIHDAAHPFTFYFKYIVSSDHSPWIFFLPLVLVTLYFSKPKFKEFAIYALICIVFFLLIISSAKSKITWYIAPIYPLTALLFGYSITKLFEAIQVQINPQNKQLLNLTLLVAFTLAIFTKPFYRRIEDFKLFEIETQQYYSGEKFDIYEEGLKKIRAADLCGQDLYIYHEIRDSMYSFNPQLNYFQKLYTEAYHCPVRVINEPDTTLRPGALLLSENFNDPLINEVYLTDTVFVNRFTNLYRIKEIK